MITDIRRRSAAANHCTCTHRWNCPSVTEGFSTAVSLHGHTEHSRESFDFLPRYARAAGLTRILERQERLYREHYGRPLDYQSAWWTPPLSPREAWDLERRQIVESLGLNALVSLTDHDNIEAGLHLRLLTETSDAPISVEWTVPFRGTFFHLGIHNLPGGAGQDIMARLAEFTADPQEPRLAELLQWLDSFGHTLIVLNHPLWDERGIGAAAHRRLMQGLIANCRDWLHALELNGLRSLSENNEVIHLARRHGMPLISGGDRHGLEPNAAVNLTRARSFEEFVQEVRTDGLSHVLFLDQYREPFRFRLVQGLLDVVRDYPELPAGRRRWTERVFYRCTAGSVKPLSSVWAEEGPPALKLFMSALRFLQSRTVRGALKFALAERQEEAAT